jgi:DNA primase small subunit
MVRHKSFKEINQLREFIKLNKPSDVYYSSAYYENPNAPMNEKNWLGADLIFDIDADHLEISCRANHGDKWICENCLDESKKEVIKLVEVLITDFGLSPNNLSVFFSGHRGYHVHVNSIEVRDLGNNERKEIVDYISGLDLDIRTIKKGYNTYNEFLKGLRPDEPGWRGRIAKGIYEDSNDFDSSDLSLVNKNTKIDQLKRIIKNIIKKNSIGIDPVVTIDTHRLIRLSETLHSKTGFRAVKIEINELEDFDPFVDTIAWNGKKEIFIINCPRFRIGNEEFGPFEKKKVELPMAGVILLLCKKRAVLID